MRYADDVALLARPVAALTATSPSTGPLHGAERQAALVAVTRWQSNSVT